MPGRSCFIGLPVDEIVISPPPPIVEALLTYWQKKRVRSADRFLCVPVIISGTLKIVEEGKMPEAGTTFRRRAGCKSRSYNWRVHMACLRRREKRREGETRPASGGEADEAVSER